MLTPEQVRAGLVVVSELEAAVRDRVTEEADPRRQRQGLAVFRHAHALRIALREWQDDEGAERRGGR